MTEGIRGAADCRAALYIRLSREDEREGPSQSVTNQQALLNEFVQKHRLQVYDTYIDDGWSGTSFDRPAFRRMIGDIEAGRVNMVITKDLSRLGRDYIMTGHYMERYFPEHRVRYISLLDGIDTGVESGVNDITPFRAIMNDMYAKDISRKIKSVKREQQRRGQFIGGKPVYGYRMHPTEKHRIVIDEAAASVVRRSFAMALSGMSCRSIAAVLNAEGVPTPAVYCGWSGGREGAGRWSSERIAELLRNETYTGSMVQGRQARVSYKSGKCLHLPRESWVVVKGTHEPLIDAESFRRVGLLLDSRRHTRSRTYDFLLKGLIFCHECGRPLGVLNRRNAAGEDVLYFVCRTYQRFGRQGGCTCHSIKERTVTDAVTARVREVCGAYLRTEALLPAAEKAVQETSQADRAAAETAALQGRLLRLTGSLDRLYDDRLSGLLPEADFQRIFSRIRDERARLEQRVRELQRRQESPVTQEDGARELAQRFSDTACTSRELLVSLIRRIELTADKEILIRFRFRSEEALFQDASLAVSAARGIAHREEGAGEAGGGAAGADIGPHGDISPKENNFSGK